MHFFPMKQSRWKNDFSAWKLHQSRELISSDPLHIPVTLKVKKHREEKKTSLQNIVIHTIYNIVQTALIITFKNKIDCETMFQTTHS